MVNILADGYTEFRFFRPNASGVFLVGDFNDWRTDQLKMVRHEDGYWVLRLPLPAGDYKFRYVADGAWYTDFAAFGIEPARFGLNSVVLVPPQTLELPAIGARAGVSAPAAAA